MRDEDEDFPPVSVRQGRDFRSHRLALNLLSASVGAEYATGETSCSVGYGCPHGMVRREADTRLASLVAPPFFWRLSCWLAGRGRKGPRGGSVPAALARPGVSTGTRVPVQAESDGCGGAAGPTSGKRSSSRPSPPSPRAGLLSLFSRVRLSATIWTVAVHVLRPWDSPSSTTGGGCHAPTPGTDSGIEPASPVSLALAGRFFFFAEGGGSLIHKSCISSREQMEKEHLFFRNLVGRKEASVYRRMPFK